MTRTSLVLLCSAVTLQLGGVSSVAGQDYMFERAPARHALVVGNDIYAYHSPVASAREDIRAVADTLLALGFSVTEASTLPRLRDFEDDILTAFGRSVEPGDVVLFYFSGHGFSYGAHNYLAPADLPPVLPREALHRHAVSVESLAQYFEDRSPGLTLLLVDACRTIAGFTVGSESRFGRKAAPLELATEFRDIRLRNSLLALAAAPGSVALADSGPGELSVFTRELVRLLDSPGREFDDLYEDVAAAVAQATGDRQVPGKIDWSRTDFFVLPTEEVLQNQKKAWRVALASGDRNTIAVFLRRNAVSLHAAAARKWLADHASSRLAEGYTRYSPEAVERAWSGDSGSLAQLAALPDGLGFLRTLPAEQAIAIEPLDDLQVGLAAKDEPAMPRWDLAALQAHGEIIATRDIPAQIPVEGAGTVPFTVPARTRLTVLGLDTVGAQVWLEVSPTNDQRIMRLPFAMDTENRVLEVLGAPAGEVILGPLIGQGGDFVDPRGLQPFLDEIRISGRTVGWVSVATESTDNLREADRRTLRRAHAVALLKEAGVEGRRITSVGFSGAGIADGVRVRVFAY